MPAPDGKTPPERIPHVDEDECVGCNLCWLVCPVPGSITMEKVETGRPFELGTANRESGDRDGIGSSSHRVIESLKKRANL